MSDTKILITNDDGVFADGLIRLAETAREFGEVWVIAPDGQRSGVGHCLTIRENLKTWKVDFPVDGVRAYACNGMPGDCVRLGVLNIVPDGPDYLFAGINSGYNISLDLQCSGTAGATMEGVSRGIHSIAFSEDPTGDHTVTDHYLRDLMEELMKAPLEKNAMWNVNFPGCGIDNCKGVLRDRKVCLDSRFYADQYVGHLQENGIVTYELKPARDWEMAEGTDVRAVYDNYVSIGTVTNLA